MSYLIWQCVQDLLTYFSTSAILQCPGSSTTHAATGISGSRRTSRKRLGRCCTWLGLKAIANIGDVDTDNLKELQGLNRCDGHVQQAEIQQPFNKLSLAECSCSIHIQILEELFPAVSANCLQDFGRQYINRHMPKLLLRNIAAVVLVQRLEYPHQSGHRLSHLRLQLKLVLLLLLGLVLHGVFDQGRCHQVHEADRNKNQKRQEEQDQVRACLNKWKVDGGQGVHSHELHQSHEGNQQAAEVLVDHKHRELIVFSKVLVLRDYLHRDTSRNEETDQEKQCDSENCFSGREKTVHEAPHDLKVAHHPQSPQQPQQT
mmetsp:Transcript_35836/g.83654  ORF Transcript_35836/g.83654 Transcript_35836/m.83654 type:complete len:316 (-) Transcript_35836:973-1920(-)